MFTLVTGGSGSGKSEYAEQLIEKNVLNQERRYYIATMIPFGDEGRKRVKKHKLQRQNRHFHTVEQYLNLSEVVVEPHADVLLECMSNLVANEVFDEQGSHENTVESIMSGIRKLIQEVDNLVVVTNEIASDGNRYDESTMEYIRILGEVNSRLAESADHVVEVVYTIPMKRK